MNGLLPKSYIGVVMLFVCMSSRIYTQTNYWELAGSPSNKPISNITFAPNGHLFAGTSETFHLYKSTDYGTTWNQIDTIVGIAFKYTMAVSHISGSIIIAGADTIYRSTDEGASWISVPYEKRIMNLSSSPNGYFFAGTPIDGIIRSTDDGLTWENYYSGLTQFSIYSFAFKESGVTFCSSYSGAVYLSTNNGEFWTPIRISSCFSDVLSMVAQNDGNLFAGTSMQGVYRTSDNGNNWINTNNGLSNTKIQSLCLNNSQYLFAGTAGGVFRSMDFGGGWVEINSGLSNLNIYTLAIGPDGRIYAGSSSGQVFRSIQSTTSVFQHQQERINNFTLSQNYPNPFNPATKIKYTVPELSFVTLKVFDIQGNEVKVLVNENKNAGNYEINFDALSLSSGIYFYQLKTENFIDTKKLLLIK